MVDTSGDQSVTVEIEYNLCVLCQCHDLLQCLHSFYVSITAAVSLIELMNLPVLQCNFTSRSIRCPTALIVKYRSFPFFLSFFTMMQQPPQWARASTLSRIHDQTHTHHTH